MMRSLHTGPPTRYRTFHFILVNTFVHEVGGHLLTTFITEGKTSTPPLVAPGEIGGRGGYGNTDVGEAGRVLEFMLFGANLEFYRDQNQGDDQVRDSRRQQIASH